MSCRSNGRGSKEILTEAALAEVADRMRAGESMAKIAASLDISGSTLTKALQRHGYDAKALREEGYMPAAQRAAIERRVARGATLLEAAMAGGADYERVRYLYRKGILQIPEGQLLANRGRAAHVREQAKKAEPPPEEQKPEDGAAEGARKRKKPVRITQNMLITAANLLRGGATMEWAAANVGASVYGLYSALKRAGYTGLTYPGRRPGTWPPERARLAERLIGEGHTLTEAAKAIDVDVALLSEWGRRGKVDTRTRRQKWKRLTEDEVRRIYARYMAEPESTPAELARIYRTHYNTLLRYWRELGLPVDRERMKRAISEHKKEDHRARQPDDATLRAAWLEYKNTYVRGDVLARSVHLTWDRLKWLWRERGYDVDRVIKCRRRGRTGRNV